MFDERPTVSPKNLPQFQQIALPTHFPVPMPIPQPMPRRAWNFLDIGLIGVGCVASLILGLTVVRDVAAGMMNADTTPDIAWVADSTAYTFCYVAVFLVALSIALLRGRTWADMGFRRTNTVWLISAVGLGIIFLPIRLVLILLIALVFGGGIENALLTEDTSTETPSTDLNLWLLVGFVQVIFMVGVLAPVVEEFIFRGILHSWAGQRLPALLAIGLTGFLFGLAHQETYLVLSNIVLGWVLSASYHYSRSLWVSMLAHFVNNAIVVGLILLLVFFIALAVG